MTATTTETTILVVDDAEVSRYLLGRWLRRNGYRVTEAATGADALASLAETPADLVLLDVNLPDMTGFEVCARVKANPDTAAVPVIHVSATAVEPEDEARGLTGGADAYLLEPVDPGVLLATVEAVLRYYRARRVAERLAARLTQLTRITLALNSAATFDDLLTAAAEGAAEMFGGEVTALTATPGERVRAATVRDGVVVLRTEAADLPAEVHPQGDPAQPSVFRVDDLTWHDGRPATLFHGRPKPSLTTVCIAIDPEDAEEDRNILLQLGQAMALAYEGLRSRSEEHTLAVTLQHSLLPREVPVVPGLSVAVRYVPAAHNVEIGGDFYEVAELGDRLLVAVGDVVGHSIQAATVMGEIRHALRAYAIEGHDTVTILHRLDALIRRFHPNWFTTMCVLLLDPATGATEVANAGHVPPLLADATGSRYLEVTGPLLGAGWDRPPATHVDLPPGTLTLLVTDGLVERRDRPIDKGMADLRDFVTHDAALEPLSDALLTHFGQDAMDDIALVAFRR